MATITSAEAKDLMGAQLVKFAEDPASFPAAMAARARAPFRYSVGNSLLIIAQTGDPDTLADVVKPATEWAKDGYLPAPGGAVGIWSKPMKGYQLPDGSTSFRKDAGQQDGAREFRAFRTVMTYPAAHVRDADGNNAVKPAEPLAGEAGEVFDTLAAWLTGQGWTVQQRPCDGHGGWTSHAEQLIRVDGAFTGWDRVRVLVHEAAHALMHGADDARTYAGEHRGDMEAEADSVAFAVLSAYGQHEAAARSVTYVAGWAASDGDRIRAAMERAAAALDAIMGALRGEDVEIRKPDTRKADNKALAAWLRAEGLPVRGDVWVAAKAGNRNVAALQALAA